MLDDKPLRRAMERALNLLSYRRRTEREMRERLAQRFERSVVDAAIRRLKRQGLIDDVEFARAWVDSRTRNSPRSARALAKEMAGKGVAREVASDAVSLLDDERTANCAAEKFARRLANAEFAPFHRKMRAHLMRRGYSEATARRASMRLWERVDSLR